MADTATVISRNTNPSLRRGNTDTSFRNANPSATVCNQASRRVTRTPNTDANRNIITASVPPLHTLPTPPNHSASLPPLKFISLLNTLARQAFFYATLARDATASRRSATERHELALQHRHLRRNRYRPFLRDPLSHGLGPRSATFWHLRRQAWTEEEEVSRKKTMAMPDRARVDKRLDRLLREWRA